MLRQFIKVSNAYQWLPLQVSAEYKQYNNFSYLQHDTTILNGEFFVKKDGLYIKFGQLEQIVNDSMALVVMGQIKQMVLSENDTPIEVYLKSKVNRPLKDTSLNAVFKMYSIQKTHIGNQDEIELMNRNTLFNTNLPLEVIRLRYDPDKEVPENVTTIKRQLIKVLTEDIKDSATLAYLSNPGIKQIEIKGKGTFVIKEDIAEYIFKHITHEDKLTLPVVITDRISKNEQGEFIPVKAYESYFLSQ
ncbi:MAG: hypothetical protein ABJB11_21255 [Ferruginibacter sp.]